MKAFSQFLEGLKYGVHFDDGSVDGLAPESMMKITKSVPFVFASTSELPLEFQHLDELPLSDEPLDLPFQACFFEAIGTSLFSFKNEVTGVITDVMGLWVYELSPRNYEMLGLFCFDGNKLAIRYSAKNKDDSLRMIQRLLKKMRKEEVGFCKTRQPVKLKVGGEKYKYRIDKIVYVSTKKQISECERVATKEIDWSHRWTVSGHWRSIPNRIGKDREGNLIKDHTWVRDHTKGPEEAPLIQKARLVR